MTYANEAEISAVRAEAQSLGLQISEEEYQKLDRITTKLKESGIYGKMDLMYAPPFDATATEVSHRINLVRHGVQ